jgi:hypothetical protein
MSSLIGKRIGGQTYYYLREVARVGGKPKIVSQRYLGKAGDIAAAMDGAAVLPGRTQHLAFGDVAAAWSVIERLGAAQIIDELTGSRRADAAASAGTYLALATLNRVVAPCSKLAFADWWATTAADRWIKIPAAALDHRRFWDAMDMLSPPQLDQIERRIGQAMTGQFALDLSGLVLDMTNFATFIDSANEKAPIAQRGKAKQKRHDLRLVGLALVVTRDGGIPVVSRAYPGNRPDVTQFTAVIDDLVSKARVTVDPAARAEIYKQVQQRIFDEVHDIVLWFRNGSIGAQTTVAGLDTIVHPNGSNLNFHKVWLKA